MIHISEFLPCPFCGSKSIDIFAPYDDAGAVVYCVDCGVEARNEYNNQMGAGEALAHWNRRVCVPDARAKATSQRDELAALLRQLTNAAKAVDATTPGGVAWALKIDPALFSAIDAALARLEGTEK